MKKILLKYFPVIRYARFILPMYKHPLNNEINKTWSPIFIIGCGRSGNTLLRRILTSHPDVHIPPETYVLGGIINWFDAYSALPWGILVNLVCSELEYYPEFVTFQTSLRDVACTLKKTDQQNRSLAFILDSIYRHHAGLYNKENARWGDKTPINAFSLPEIYKVFPNGQFVHIIRDCYDVVSSYLKSGIKHDVSDAAIRWVESIKLIKKFSSDYSISFYELKYEDLVNNPEYEIKNLCDFLNINFSNEMIDSSPDEGLGDVEMREHHKNVKEKINSNSIGKGRDILSKKDIEKINRIAEKTITKMGYSVITL